MNYLFPTHGPFLQFKDLYSDWMKIQATRITRILGSLENSIPWNFSIHYCHNFLSWVGMLASKRACPCVIGPIWYSVCVCVFF